MSMSGIVPVPNRPTLKIQHRTQTVPMRYATKDLAPTNSNSAPESHLTKPKLSDTLSRVKQSIEAQTSAFKENAMGIVAVENLPKRKTAERKSKYPFTPDEIKAAVKQFKKDGKVGAGPYDPIPGRPLRSGRSAAQRLKALVCEAGEIEPTTVSTTAWADDTGEWAALVAKPTAA